MKTQQRRVKMEASPERRALLCLPFRPVSSPFVEPNPARLPWRNRKSVPLCSVCLLFRFGRLRETPGGELTLANRIARSCSTCSPAGFSLRRLRFTNPAPDPHGVSSALARRKKSASRSVRFLRSAPPARSSRSASAGGVVCAYGTRTDRRCCWRSAARPPLALRNPPPP